jgi:6-phosphogluconolactonase (cycloisomerase 2 family)
MANSTTNLDLISSSQAQKEITANALFDASSPASLFGRRSSTTSSLTWGYYGGNINEAGIVTNFPNGTITLTPSATNYIYLDNTALTLHVNTTGFLGVGYTNLYSIITGSASVISYIDYRSFFSKGGYVLPTASTTVLGGVKVDGTTVTINGAGVISASGGGGSTFLQSSYPVLAPTKDTNIYDGQLTQNGIPLYSGYGSFALTNNYVFMNYSGNLKTYSINKTNGLLTFKYNNGASATEVVTDPFGRFLYQLNQLNPNSHIIKYTINTSGSLTSISSDTLISSYAKSLTIDPFGRFLYAINTSNSTISMFSIDQTTGELTSSGTDITPGGSSLSYMTIDPTGSYLYLTNSLGLNISNILVYSINQTTGFLTLIQTTASTLSFPYELIVEPTGRFLYVSNAAGTNGISIFSINKTNGNITKIGSDIGTYSSMSSLTIDNTGKFLYFKDYTSSGSINICKIDQNFGTLEILTPLVLGAGFSQYLLISKDNNFVYCGFYPYARNNFLAGSGGFAGHLQANKGATFTGDLVDIPQFTTATAPAYRIGAMYFDTTLNKLRIGGATAWETITSA